MIAEHDIEACIWQGNTLAAGVHQRKIDICSSHETARVQLARRVVETDRACATSRQSDGPLRRATAKLQHVFASNVAQDAQLVFGDVPDAPNASVIIELCSVRRLVLVAEAVPGVAIMLRVLREAHTAE